MNTGRRTGLMHRVRTEIDGAMPTDLVQTRQHLG